MRFTYQTGAQPLAGYTIQRGIHRGGFGEVYFAHSDGGKEVALKLLHQQDQDIEIRGVTQCLNLKHPNLINLFDLKTDAQGDHWVVMEYVAGSSLEDVLASFPDGLPPSEVRDWLSGLVAGVAHLHDRGIVHRDLKPANVYRENGVVKVGDVGLSKRLDSDHRRQHTQSVGTVYYMAPEVARGQYGPEVDVYSLGVMLYELISGKLPFTGETTAEILMKHLTAQPDLTPIPKSLRPTLARSLEKDPRKRTPTVRELERDFLRASGVASEPQTIPESSFLPPPVPSRSNGHSTNNARPSNGERVDRPLPNYGFDRTKSTSQSNAHRVGNPRKLSTFTIMFVVFLFLFGPNVWYQIKQSPWLGLLTVFVVIQGYKYFQKLKSKSREYLRAETIWSPFAAHLRTSSPPVTRPSHLDPDRHMAPLDRSWSERLPELANSLGLAAVVASVLSMSTYLSLGIYQSLGAFPQSSMMPSVEHAVLFAATSVVGSWFVLIGHAATVGPRWTNRQRWFARLAAGAIIGTIAYAMNEFLMVNTPPMAFVAQSAFSSLGAHPLTVHGVDPTWLGYAWFFAGWLGIRRWTRELDPNRKERFRVWLVASAVAVAYAMSMMFKFPQWYAMLWAGTISTTVQLASIWIPNRSSVERR